MIRAMFSPHAVGVRISVCILVTFLTSTTGVTLAKNGGDGATDLEFNITEFESRLDRFIRAGLKCHNNPALTISVVRQGQTVMAKGYGNVTLDDVRPVTNTTLFGIASLSKAFAATLILQLIEENPSVSLSSKVTDLLGEDVFMDRLQARYTTLQDLLAHRVGLPSNNNIRLDSTLTRANLPGRIKFLKTNGGFRTSFMYSNLMYGLVTCIAELLGNDTWENLVQDRIFRPLGMTSSTFATTADPSTLDLVQGYQDSEGGLHPVPFEFSRHWAELCGSGCILSNAVDMAQWIKFHLKNGMSEDNQTVLGSSLHATMFDPENIIKSGSTEKYYSRPITPVTLTFPNYGMGWKLGTYRGFRIISHTGSTFGYRAMLNIMPGHDLGLFVAMAGDDPWFLFRTNVHLYALDLLLGEEPWLDHQTACTFPEPWQKTPSSRPYTPLRDDIPLARPGTDYEGVYHNDAYGQASISSVTNSNKLNMVLGIGQFSLLPKSSKDNDVFAVVSEGMIQYLIYISEVRFEINGSDASIVIPSFDNNDPPVFERTGPARHEKHKNSGTSISTNIMTLTNILMTLVVLK